MLEQQVDTTLREQENRLAIAAIKDKIADITKECARALASLSLTADAQETIKKTIIQKTKDLLGLIHQHVRNTIMRKVYIEQLVTDETIYAFHKLSSRQGFGIRQQSTLPRNVVTEQELVRGTRQGGSANETQQARLSDSGRLVFCKNTHPEVAQLEVIAADFFRHSLDGRTAQGKIIVDDRNITGMYVAGIPGFVSMRVLTDLAKLANEKQVETAIKERTDKIKEKIEKIKQQLAAGAGNAKQLKTELQELQNYLGTYDQIVTLKLIDTKTHSVNLRPIAGLIAKALCPAFFYEDWDRHKDNFGLSFAVPGGLGIASLDYDKSLTGIFGQDGKAYDWSITPKRLRDFPNFNCWYWPSSSNKYRLLVSSIFAPKKTPKMYSDEEARQYSMLKNDPKFREQKQIEWLKLVFIPQKLRENSVQTLAIPTCQPSPYSRETLAGLPAILETKRRALLESLVRLKEFRETFANENTKNALLQKVKTELRNALTPEEFAIVNEHWDEIQTDITQKINAVKQLEEFTRNLGYTHLIKTIEETGISFSPSLTTEQLALTLSRTTISMTTKEISKLLNEELGLDISSQNARKIKEELLLKKLCMTLPGNLGERLKEINFTIQNHSFPRKKTSEILNQLALQLKKLENKPTPIALQTTKRCLRWLGVPEEIISDTLKRCVQTPSQKSRSPSRP